MEFLSEQDRANLSSVQRHAAQRWRRMLSQESFEIPPYDLEGLEVYSQLLFFATSTMFTLTCLNAYGHRWSSCERLQFELMTIVLPWIANWTILVGWTNHMSGLFLLATLLPWRNVVRNLNESKQEAVMEAEESYAQPDRVAILTNLRGMAVLAMVIYMSCEQCSVFPESVRFHPRHYTLSNMGLGMILLLNGLFDSDWANKRSWANWAKKDRLIMIFSLINAYYNVYHKERYGELGMHWNPWMTSGLIREMASNLSKLVGGGYPALFIGAVFLCAQKFNLPQELPRLLTRPVRRVPPGQFYGEYNREMFLSLFGHLAVYLIGAGMGRLVRSYAKQAEEEPRQNKHKTLGWLVLWCLGWAAFLCLLRFEAKSEMYVVVASFGYCCWLFGVAFFGLGLLAAIEALFRYRTKKGTPFRTLMIYRWINDYALWFLAYGSLAHECIREFQPAKFLANPYFGFITVAYATIAALLIGYSVCTLMELLFKPKQETGIEYCKSTCPCRD